MHGASRPRSTPKRDAVHLGSDALLALFLMIDYEITNPAPMIQTDIDLVRKMNPFQRSLAGPFETWPEWAKRDAQIVANYRRSFTINDGPG